MPKKLLRADVNGEILDLNDIRIFTYVAALRSFPEAANLLKISNSSVSRSLVRLEGMLGVALLDRTTRKVRLTEAGEELKDGCMDILTKLGETVGYVGALNASPRGLLTVWISRALGLSAHAQRLLPKFLLQFPGVRVSLRFESQSWSQPMSDVDIAIFATKISSECPQAGLLARIPRVLCATPAYLARRHSITRLTDLKEHLMIASESHEDAFGQKSSETWEEALFLDARPSLTIADPVQLRLAVLEGIGIGCLLGHLCREDLASGRLVQLLPKLSLEPVGMSASYPTERTRSPAVKSFVDIIVSNSHAGGVTGQTR